MGLGMGLSFGHNFDDPPIDNFFFFVDSEHMHEITLIITIFLVARCGIGCYFAFEKELRIIIGMKNLYPFIFPDFLIDLIIDGLEFMIDTFEIR